MTMSEMVANDAQRFSTSSQFLGANSCGAKSARYHASASS